MARYASSKPSAKEREHYSGPQDPEDILCEGSDAEQTTEERANKRRRYDKIGKRYACGHRPLIQSAILQGPLGKENGWVNPWRPRPWKETDRRKPDSQDVLSTRDNMMRRASDDGVSYLNPMEALTWCKAAVQKETRLQFDSMEFVHPSRDSELNGMNEETPRQVFTKAQPTPTGIADGNRVSCDKSESLGPYSADDDQFHGKKPIGCTNGNSKSLIRPLNSDWLKGPCALERADWEDRPLASPTPLLDHLSKREQRHRNVSAKSAGSDNGRRNLVSVVTLPWSNDAPLREEISRYSGSEAQGTCTKGSRRNFGRPPDHVDKLSEGLRETTFSSTSNFLPVFQGKNRRSQCMDGSFSEITHGTFNKSFTTPAEAIDGSIPQRSAPELNNPPLLNRSPENRGRTEIFEDDSLITEVAPSSRDLQTFQFRKKRMKSKKYHSTGSHEDFNDSMNGYMLSSRSGPVDKVEELLDCGFSVAMDRAHRLPFQPLREELNTAFDNNTYHAAQLLRGILLPSEEHTRMETETSSSWSRHYQSHYRRFAKTPVSLVPNSQITSPSALFGRSAVNLSTPSTEPAILLYPNAKFLDDIDHDLALKKEEATVDASPVCPLISENQHCFAACPKLPRKRNQRASSPFLPDPTEINRHYCSEDQVKVGNTSTPHVELASTKISAFQQGCCLGNADLSAASLDTAMKSRSTPKSRLQFAELDQETSLHDGTTQSLNTTLPKSPRKSQIASQILSVSHRRLCPMSDTNHVENIFSKVPNEFNDKEGISSNTSHDKASRLQKDAAIDSEASASKIGTEPNEAVQGETELTQNTLTQDFGRFSSSDSTLSKKDQVLLKAVGAAIVETAPETATPLALDEQDEPPPVEQDQYSWQGCELQSPWAPEIHFSAEIASTNQPCEIRFTPDHEGSLICSRPSPRARDEGISEWQRPTSPATPENDGVMPFQDFMTPEPSPRQPECLLKYENVSITQQLIDATTKNPWATGSKKSASTKSKKGVSFGIPMSKAEPDSQPESLTFSKQGPESPPPPQPLEYPQEKDTVNGDARVNKKFRNHFAAVARCNRALRRDSGPLLSSPLVVAMAERFIAADQESSIEQDRRCKLSENPIQHLKPRRNVMKISSPKTTDDDLEVTLKDFLGDAEDFLADWSVDSEIKKIRESRGRDSRRDASRIDLLGVTTGW